MTRICIVPRVEGLAGVASFRIKFEEGLRARNVEVTHDLSLPADAVLVLAGTRSLIPLLQARQRGQRIVQRLDGINWVHKKRNTGLKHYMRAEYGNFVLSFIRKHLATKIIYQSQFSKEWWESWYGASKKLSTVIHNGVDLKTYNAAPDTVSHYPPYKLLLVEGNLGGGYEMGLDNAIKLAENLNEVHHLPVELNVVGKISSEHQARVQAQAKVPIQWLGSVPRERIPELDRSAHLFFSSDLHPACPNSVIEALACGLPVIAFDTGSLKELVIGDAGRVVPYGSNSWNIEEPDISALGIAAKEILQNLARFQKSARAHAESALGLDAMTDKYLKFILGDV